MLIDSLTFTLEKSGALDAFWNKLDVGEDGTLGVASSARPLAKRTVRQMDEQFPGWGGAAPSSPPSSV